MAAQVRRRRPAVVPGSISRLAHDTSERLAERRLGPGPADVDAVMRVMQEMRNISEARFVLEGLASELGPDRRLGVRLLYWAGMVAAAELPGRLVEGLDALTTPTPNAFG